MHCNRRIVAGSGVTLLKIVWIVFACALFISGCASSQVARNSAANVDSTVSGTQGAVSSIASDSDVADTYQNASQTSKGAILGGGAGAITGAIYSSRIGVLPGAALGALIGAGIGAYIDMHTTLRDRIVNRGASIITLGDQILVVLPSSRLFESGTADLKPQAYSTLDMVTTYLNRYTKTLVKISAYTNAAGQPAVNLAISKQQAHQVEKYLLNAGLNARTLVADGYGGTSLVARPGCAWDDGDNYRVEITLEKLEG